MATATAAIMTKSERLQRKARIKLMRERGYTYASIAARFGISSSRVYAIVRLLQRERILAEQWPFWSLLSNRSRNVLGGEFGDAAFSHPEIILHYGRKRIAGLRLIGPQAVREIEQALTRTGHLARGQEW